VSLCAFVLIQKSSCSSQGQKCPCALWRAHHAPYRPPEEHQHCCPAGGARAKHTQMDQWHTQPFNNTHTHTHTCLMRRTELTVSGFHKSYQ